MYYANNTGYVIGWWSNRCQINRAQIRRGRSYVFCMRLELWSNAIEDSIVLWGGIEERKGVEGKREVSIRLCIDDDRMALTGWHGAKWCKAVPSCSHAANRRKKKKEELNSQDRGVSMEQLSMGRSDQREGKTGDRGGQVTSDKHSGGNMVRYRLFSLVQAGQCRGRGAVNSKRVVAQECREV